MKKKERKRFQSEEKLKIKERITNNRIKQWIFALNVQKVPLCEKL